MAQVRPACPPTAAELELGGVPTTGARGNLPAHPAVVGAPLVILIPSHPKKETTAVVTTHWQKFLGFLFLKKNL